MLTKRLAAAALMMGLWLAPHQVVAQGSGSSVPAHVYFLRGFMGVLSPGLEDMAAQLSRRGIETSLHGHLEWPSVAEAALSTYRSRRTRAIIFVGHSLGAGAAFQAAERLKQAGVPVRLIVALDPVARVESPSNVQRVVNMYFPNGMGAPIDRARGGRGSVDNIQLSANAEYDHFSMGTAPQIQRRVLRHVLAASGTAGKGKIAR